MSADPLRLFVAIDLPPEGRQRVAAEIEALRTAGADVRWVPPEQLHLTLHFVGDFAAGRVPELCAALRAVPGPGALELALAGLGRFPPAGRGAPRVFWAGIAGPGLAALGELAGAVAAATGALGVAADRRGFTPHLTLCRVRSSRGLRALEALAEARGPDLALALPAVARFALYRSELGPAGAVHTVVEDFPLGRAPAGEGGR